MCLILGDSGDCPQRCEVFRLRNLDLKESTGPPSPKNVHTIYIDLVGFGKFDLP
jgi:hypothetical protein